MAGPPGAPIEDDVRLGFIGVGDRGGRQLLEWDFLPLQGVRIVAVADPFQSRREERAARVRHYGMAIMPISRDSVRCSLRATPA